MAVPPKAALLREAGPLGPLPPLLRGLRLNSASEKCDEEEIESSCKTDRHSACVARLTQYPNVRREVAVDLLQDVVNQPHLQGHHLAGRGHALQRKHRMEGSGKQHSRGCYAFSQGFRFQKRD